MDLSGAFPNTPRSVLRSQLKTHLPLLVPLFDVMYGSPNKHRILKDDGLVHELTQFDGVTQGSETSSLFFMLVSMLPLSSRLDRYKDVLTNYLDDMTVVSDIDSAKADYHALKAAFANIGLDMQPAKCKLYMPFATEETCQQHAEELGIQAVAPDKGVKVLGLPIGEEAWVKAELSDMVDDFDSGVSRVSDKVSYQSLHNVLRATQSMFQHILAAIPPSMTSDLASRVDFITQRTFEKAFYGDALRDLLGKTALNLQGQPHQHGQESLTNRQLVLMRMEMPIRMGGFGVLSLRTRLKYAYAISMAKVKTQFPDVWTHLGVGTHLRQEFQSALTELKWNEMSIGSIAKRDVSKSCQVYEEYREVLLQCDDRNVARALVTSTEPGAGTFLTTRAIDRDRTLKNQEFKFAVLKRMGIGASQVFGLPDGALCPRCHRPLTFDHLTSCHNGMIARHDAIRDQVQRMVLSAGVSCQVERQTSGASQQRIDVFTKNYFKPENRVTHPNCGADVTVVAPYQPTDQLPRFGREIRLAEEKKIKKYTQGEDNYASEQRAVIVPLVMTTFGAFGPGFRKFIAQTMLLAGRTGRYMYGVDEHFANRWKQIFSCTLIRYQTEAATQLLGKDLVDHVAGEIPLA